MEKKKISVLTFVLVIIIVLAIGVAAGYFVSIKLNEKDTAQKVETKNEIPVKDSEEKEEENIIENKIEEVTEKEEEEEDKEEDDDDDELASGERKLTQNELDLFEQYLEGPEIRNYLSGFYEDISEFDLKQFLKYHYNSREATDEEIKKITGEDDPPVPVHLYDKYTIDNSFKKHTGQDVSIIKPENLPDYSEEFKCYYNRTSDWYGGDINVLSGIEKGNEYILKYDSENGTVPHNEVTLKKVDGNFLFISNMNVY